MPQVNWWENLEYTHAILKVAEDLDQQYPERKLISLGHSPSWIIVAVAMVRQMREVPSNVAFIPFSGCHMRADYEISMKHIDDRVFGDEACDQDLVSFHPESVLDVSINSRRDYFNYLSSRHLIPSPQEENRPVIVEYSCAGRGIASFVDAISSYPEDIGFKRDEFPYDFHLYKLLYRDGIEDIKIKLSDENCGEIKLPVTTQTGKMANLVSSLGGYGGVISPNSNDEYAQKAETRSARFMPYYSLVDGYAPECITANKNKPLSGLFKATVNPDNIRSAKSALRDATLMDTEQHEELATQGIIQHSVDNRRVIEGRWRTMTRGYH